MANVLLRRCRRVVLAAACGTVLLGGFAWTLVESLRPHASAARLASTDLVRWLALTDLVLVTEARYLRHLSLADRHSPFQDHPFAFEHFPSGAVIGVPRHLRGIDAPLGTDAGPARPADPPR